MVNNVHIYLCTCRWEVVVLIQEMTPSDHLLMFQGHLLHCFPILTPNIDAGIPIKVQLCLTLPILSSSWLKCLSRLTCSIDSSCSSDRGRMLISNIDLDVNELRILSQRAYIRLVASLANNNIQPSAAWSLSLLLTSSSWLFASCSCPSHLTRRLSPHDELWTGRVSLERRLW